MLSKQEQIQDHKLQVLERKAAKRSGRISQRTMGAIRPQGPTVITARIGGKDWAVTLSAPVGSEFQVVRDSVEQCETLGSFLQLAQIIERKYRVTVGLVPKASPLYRPMLRKESRVKQAA